jgi:hypothetical protein
MPVIIADRTMMVLKNSKNGLAMFDQRELRARGCQSIPFLPKH